MKANFILQTIYFVAYLYNVNILSSSKKYGMDSRRLLISPCITRYHWRDVHIEVMLGTTGSTHSCTEEHTPITLLLAILQQTRFSPTYGDQLYFVRTNTHNLQPTSVHQQWLVKYSVNRRDSLFMCSCLGSAICNPPEQII